MTDQDRRLILTVRVFSYCVLMDRDVLVCICASFSDVVLFDFQALVSANIIVASVAISCSSGGSIQETDCLHQQHNHLYFYQNASHMFYNRGWCNTASLELVSGLIT